MPVGSILGGMIGAGGAYQAGNAAAAAGNDAASRARDETSKNRAIVAPWTSAGADAEGELASLYGLGHLNSGDAFGARGIDQTNRAGDQADAMARFTYSPGYQFRLQQGVNALDRSGASRGMLLSGAQTQGLNDYAQGQASGEYGNYVSGLNSLAGTGLNAATTTNNTNAGIFNQGNALQFQGAQAQAASYQAGANAIGSGIAHGINNLASISGLYGPMQGASYGGLSNFFGGGGGGAQAGGYSLAGAPAGGYGGYAGYADTLPGFGGNALAAGGAGAGAGGSAAGAGAGLTEMAPALAAL